MENIGDTPEAAASLSRGTLTFDEAVYCLTAIKKAAYKFSDRCWFSIESQNQRVSVTVDLKDSCPSTLQDVLGEFSNEVLDQDLREQISRETEALRNLIVAHAFSRTSIIDTDLEIVDYREDPLGIGRGDGGSPEGGNDPRP